MNTKKQHHCPKEYLIEGFVNRFLSSSAEIEEIANHLKSCLHCQFLSHELKQFYSIFDEASFLPVPNSVLEKIRQIEFGRIAFTGISLKPVQPLNGHLAMDFRSKIVYSTQNFYQKDLVDMNYLPTEKSEILIRVIQSLATQETTFYVYSRTKKLYCNIQLRLDATKKIYQSDCCGKIELGRYDIRSLDNKIVTVIAGQ